METHGQAKNFFFLVQVGILGVLALILIVRGTRKDGDSNFATREGDRKRGGSSPGGRGEGRPALQSPQADTARSPERPKPAELEGIRIDAAPHIILGIAPDASRSEIQRAYRDRMKQYHPDLVGPPGSREWKDAQKIAEAINRAKEEMLKRTRL